MRIIFCSSPLSPREVDPEYAEEWAAAGEAGFARTLIDIEALLAGSTEQAIRRIAALDERVEAIYRGWMLPVDRYAEMHSALAGVGVDLLTPPDAYRRCHHLPENYGDIIEHTPRTVWLRESEGLGIDNVMACLSTFHDAAVIVKDFVKSRKHEWNEACYIPNAADRAGVERVVGNFVRGQGTDLAEGLVFREYVPLKRLAINARTGAPVSVEYRLFFVNGVRTLCAAHFDAVQAVDLPMPPLPLFDEVGARIPNPFFSMDIALTEAGDWIIVELGDGQVAGLPEAVDTADFYAKLASSVNL